MKYFFIILLGILLLHCKTPVKSSSAAPEVKKNSAEWYYQKGILEHKVTNTYVAIDYFTKAIKKNPDYIEAYMERAKASLSVDSIHNAIRDYDSLFVKMKPNDYVKLGELNLMKGDALYLASQDSAACSCYRKARDLNNQPSWDRIRKRCK